jgi:hypothetical protein
MRKGIIRLDRDIDDKAPQNHPARFSPTRYADVFETRNVRVSGSGYSCMRIRSRATYMHSRTYGPHNRSGVGISEGAKAVATLGMKPKNRTRTAKAPYLSKAGSQTLFLTSAGTFFQVDREDAARAAC